MRRQLIVAALFIPFAAFAASLTGPPAETIIVTAHRTPEDKDRVGSAVSLLTQDQLQERQVSVAVEALRAVPGVSISRSGPIGAQTQVRMRGAEGNQVLILIDGVEANDLAGGNEFAFEHLTAFDIERIEVVRGPQSALWGSDALAGVINVVTRRPTQALETEEFVEGGSFGFINGGGYVGARSGRSSFSAAASRFQTDGTNASRTGNEDDAYGNTTGSLAASYDFSPRLTIDFTGRHSDASKDYDTESLATGLAADDANDDGVTDHFLTDSHQSYLRFGGAINLFDGRWTHQLHYGITDTETRTEAEDLFSSGEIDVLKQEGDKYGVYYQTSVQVTQAADDHPGHVLTLAVDHEREVFRQRGEIADFSGTIYDPNQDQGLHQTGVVAEYLAYFGSDLSLSGGVRHDNNSAFDDVTTWRATASWRLPTVATRLHASVGTGQTTPTFTDRFGFYPGQFAGNPNLGPETSTGWDAGLEQRFLEGRLIADVTYFRADLDDEINGFACLPPTFVCTAVNEDGTSHRKGVELSLDMSLGRAYSLNAAYTYTDATQPGDSGGQIREVRRPLHSASLNLKGRWLNERLNVNFGVYYTGDREDNFFPPFPEPQRRVTLGSYTLVNAAVSYRVNPRLTIYGRVENALDDNYEDVYGFNTPGAAGFAGVRVSFDR